MWTSPILFVSRFRRTLRLWSHDNSSRKTKRVNFLWSKITLKGFFHLLSIKKNVCLLLCIIKNTITVISTLFSVFMGAEFAIKIHLVDLAKSALAGARIFLLDEDTSQFLLSTIIYLSTFAHSNGSINSLVMATFQAVNCPYANFSSEFVSNHCGSYLTLQ